MAGGYNIFDFFRTDAEEEESVSVDDNNNSSEDGKNEETTSATTTIRMGGRGIARMLEIALSSPPPPSPSLTTTATTATSIVSANATLRQGMPALRLKKIDFHSVNFVSFICLFLHTRVTVEWK